MGLDEGARVGGEVTPTESEGSSSRREGRGLGDGLGSFAHSAEGREEGFTVGE